MNKEVIKPGVIFYSSWGYEQTNVSYYQVVSVIGKCTVEVRELSQVECTKKYTAFSGLSMPKKDHFKSDSFRKRVLQRESGPTLKICDFEHAYLWDGKPQYVSSYA